MASGQSSPAVGRVWSRPGAEVTVVELLCNIGGAWIDDGVVSVDAL